MNIKGIEIQQLIDEIYNNQPDLPDFMKISDAADMDYTVDTDGIIYDCNEMCFFNIEIGTPRERIVRLIAEAVIEQSL